MTGDFQVVSPLFGQSTDSSGLSHPVDGHGKMKKKKKGRKMIDQESRLAFFFYPTSPRLHPSKNTPPKYEPPQRFDICRVEAKRRHRTARL